jgi:hypothetical protein
MRIINHKLGVYIVKYDEFNRDIEQIAKKLNKEYYSDYKDWPKGIPMVGGDCSADRGYRYIAGWLIKKNYKIDCDNDLMKMLTHRKNLGRTNLFTTVYYPVPRSDHTQIVFEDYKEHYKHEVHGSKERVETHIHWDLNLTITHEQYNGFKCEIYDSKSDYRTYEHWSDGIVVYRESRDKAIIDGTREAIKRGMWKDALNKDIQMSALIESDCV